MAKLLLRAALLVLLAGSFVQVHGALDDILEGTSLDASLYEGGGCGLADAAAATCQCRNIFLVVHSGSRDRLERGPHLNLTLTAFEGGQECQTSSPTLIAPGKTGGVQVGNRGNTKASGVEADVWYSVLARDGKTKLKCSVKFLVKNPVVGPPAFGWDLRGKRCPKKLKVELGQYVPGDTGAAVEYHVYFDKDGDNRADRRLLSDRRKMEV